MTNKIKKAFDGIKAEDELKANTLIFLRNQIKYQQKTLFLSAKRLTVTAALFTAIIITGVFSYNFYYTASAYVDIDVNPSIELVLNQFDRVIGSHAYNNDGENILLEVSLMHKSYDDAINILINNLDQKGYIGDNSIVSVTLQSGDQTIENQLLANIKTNVEATIYEHHNNTEVDVFVVSSETRSVAHEQGISPAKYLAIQELQTIDSTVTIESCKEHSISEIKQLTRENTDSHHSNKMIPDTTVEHQQNVTQEQEVNNEEQEINQTDSEHNMHHKEYNRQNNKHD